MQIIYDVHSTCDMLVYVALPMDYTCTCHAVHVHVCTYIHGVAFLMCDVHCMVVKSVCPSDCRFWCV